MNRDQLSREMQEQIRKTVLSYSIFRPESAIIIALTMIFVTLSVLGLPWFPGAWWMWLLFGLVGEGLIVLSTLRDPKFYERVMDEIFHDKYDVNKIKSPELRQKVAKALQYRELISQEIVNKPDQLMDDYLRDAAHGLEDWIGQVYRLALSLDDYQRRNPMIASDMDSVQKDLAKYKAQLVREKGSSVQEDIARTVSIKQSQLDALLSLRDTVAKANLQLEDTLAAIGTIYTQMVLIGSKDMNSSRAQRLQQDMLEQVHALQDTSSAIDEVYQTSAAKRQAS